MFRNFLRSILRMTKVAPVVEAPPKDAVLHGVASGRVEKPTTSEAVVEKAGKRIKPAKYALLMAYQGKNYFGMQVQPQSANMPTIESNLLAAMRAVGIITAAQELKPFDFYFQRAARTDRKVSAVRQVVSFSLPLTPDFVDSAPAQLNAHLPADIRVLAVRKTIPSFHSQKRCDYRTYSYTLPTFAFAPVEELTTPSYRMDEARLQEVNDVLSIFEGTHNFYNYTSKKEHKDQSCNRYIISFQCGKPFLHTQDYGFKQTEFEFTTVFIRGQSFMLHQIRKMIGMAIIILRGLQNKSDVTRSFESQRMDVPRAPGLGLILEKVHYGNYDKQFGKTHATIDDLGPEIEREESKIREELIIKEILETEAQTNSMFMWLADLGKHNFNVDPESEEPVVSKICMARGVANGALDGNEGSTAAAADEEKEDVAGADDADLPNTDAEFQSALVEEEAKEKSISSTA